MIKSLHSLGSCAQNFLLIHISSILSVIFTRLWLKCQRVFWWASWPAASQQGMLGALIVWWPASFWLQWTMAEGTVHTGGPAKFPTKPTEEWIKIRKMYAIKQIKICGEYRDMLPRPRLDLSGTPGLRPIGLSPGSWQTSLGLGSMSRYSPQILICITQCALVTPYGNIDLVQHLVRPDGTKPLSGPILTSN